MASGYPTADHYLAAVTPQQWREAIAYAGLEPFGPRQQALMTAHLIAAILGPHGVQVDISETLERLGFYIPSTLPADDAEAVELSARIGRASMPIK